jgi:hypothetical protein
MKWSNVICDAIVAIAFAVFIVTLLTRSFGQPTNPMARWSVDLIRSRTKHLGTVEAATEKQAIEAAIKQFNIAPAWRNRITVSRSAIGVTTDLPPEHFGTLGRRVD